MINAAQINTAVMERFKRLLYNHRLAHAYLLAGPQDSGKTQTALSLAQLVNCTEEGTGPCGACASCRKIASGQHPDVHVLGSDEMESIKIEEIRYLLNRAHLMAFEARTKVFIIRNAERMTPDAANALLKTLEEPAPKSLMILTTSVLEANLDTIKSRCHIIQFYPSPVNRIAQMLTQEGISHQEARFLAAYADGCLGKTRKLIKKDIILFKHKVLQETLNNRNNDPFLKDLASNPAEAAEALHLLMSFFRDIVLIKCGVERTETLNQDEFPQMERFLRRGVDDLSAIIRRIVQTKKLLEEQLNIRMSLSLLREDLWAN